MVRCPAGVGRGRVRARCHCLLRKEYPNGRDHHAPGLRYQFHSGPYADAIDAYDRRAALIEYGELSDETAAVIGCSIYIQVNEPANAD